MADCKFTATGKLTRVQDNKNKVKLAELLAEDYLAPTHVLAKRLRVPRRTVSNYIYSLRKRGNPDAVRRSENLKERKRKSIEIRAEIIEYVRLNPDCNTNDIRADLELTQRQVFNHLQFIKKKNPNFKVTECNFTIPAYQARKRILDFMMVNPQSSQHEIQRALGLSAGLVSKVMKNIDNDLRSEIQGKRMMVLNYLFEELLLAKHECESRLSKIKAPTHGARWMELKLTAMRDMMKLFRLGSPENEINVQINVDSDRCDAAASAIEKSIELQMESNIKLPDFSRQEKQIEYMEEN